MTNDGQQPPIKQRLIVIAVHQGPATRARCGPLLLVLLLIGEVATLFVSLFVFCMLSDV